jgi:hypothetical protein
LNVVITKCVENEVLLKNSKTIFFFEPPKEGEEEVCDRTINVKQTGIEDCAPVQLFDEPALTTITSFSNEKFNISKYLDVTCTLDKDQKKSVKDCKGWKVNEKSLTIGDVTTTDKDLVGKTVKASISLNIQVDEIHEKKIVVFSYNGENGFQFAVNDEDKLTMSAAEFDDEKTYGYATLLNNNSTTLTWSFMSKLKKEGDEDNDKVYAIIDGIAIEGASVLTPEEAKEAKAKPDVSPLNNPVNATVNAVNTTRILSDKKQSLTVPLDNEEKTIATDEEEKPTVTDKEEKSTAVDQKEKQTATNKEEESTATIDEEKSTASTDEGKPTATTDEEKPTATTDEEKPTASVDQENLTTTIEEDNPSATNKIQSTITNSKSVSTSSSTITTTKGSSKATSAEDLDETDSLSIIESTETETLEGPTAIIGDEKPTSTILSSSASTSISKSSSTSKSSSSSTDSKNSSATDISNDDDDDDIKTEKSEKVKATTTLKVASTEVIEKGTNSLEEEKETPIISEKPANISTVDEGNNYEIDNENENDNKNENENENELENETDDNKDTEQINDGNDFGFGNESDINNIKDTEQDKDEENSGHGGMILVSAGAVTALFFYMRSKKSNLNGMTEAMREVNESPENERFDYFAEEGFLEDYDEVDQMYDEEIGISVEDGNNLGSNDDNNNQSQNLI